MQSSSRSDSSRHGNLLSLTVENSLQNIDGATSLHLLNHISEPKLLVCPKRRVTILDRNTNTKEATLTSPFTSALDAELLPDAVKRSD